MLQPVGYERGLHLRGTPIWFDAERRRELCVLTGMARQLPPLHRRVVASAELAAALGRAGYAGSILPTPWERWLGLGGHRVQLIDAGVRPGIAAALILQGDERLLVAGLLRTVAVPWPRASHLVVHVPAVAHAGQPMNTVVAGLALELEALLTAGLRPTVLVEAVDVGLALWDALVAYGQVLRPLGLLAKFAGAAKDLSSRLPTMALAARQRQVDAHVLRVDSGLGVFEGAAGEATDSAIPPPWRLRWYADAACIAQVASQCGAKRVSLAGVDSSAESAVLAALPRGVEARFISDARQLQLGHGSCERRP